MGVFIKFDPQKRAFLKKVFEFARCFGKSDVFGRFEKM